MLRDLLTVHGFSVSEQLARGALVVVGDLAQPCSGHGPACVVLRDGLTLEETTALLDAGASHVLPRSAPDALLLASVKQAANVGRLRAAAAEAQRAQHILVIDSLSAATENIGLVGALEAVLRAAHLLLSPARGALWLAGRADEIACISGEETDHVEALDGNHEVVARQACRTSAEARQTLNGMVFEAHPILLDGRCEGALSLAQSDPAVLDDPDRAALVALLLSHAEAAMRRERLFTDLRSSSVKIQSLFEVGLAMASETSLQRLFEVIVESASRICGAERCSLMVRERHLPILRMRAAKGIPPDVMRTVQVNIGEGIAGTVAASGNPLFIADIETDSRFGRQNAQQYRNSSLVCVPIRLRDEVAGVISINNKTDGSAFNANDLNLMTLLASQAAVAIDNAKRYQDLNEKAITDGLTGVYLRRYFDECLAKAVETATAGTRGFTLLMIDIDHFKRVNDTYGHPAGDAVLRGVAARLRAAVRDEDLVARYGGEEFAVILAIGDKARAQQIAERVRKTVAKGPIEAEHHSIEVTISIGLAAYEPGLDDPGLVVTVADSALYRAKSTGRNRVVAAPLEESES